MDIYFRLGVAGASHALSRSGGIFDIFAAWPITKENNETRERVACLTTLYRDGLILELIGPAMLHD